MTKIIESPIPLLPCPFCGGKAKMADVFTAERFLAWELSFWVGCYNPSCSISPSCGGSIPEVLAEIWNKRVKGDDE